MLSTLTAGALVTAGGAVKAASVTVEVLRPFLVAGERIEVGTRIALSGQVAAEVIAANKARVAPPEPPAAPAPETAPVAAEPEAEQPADETTANDAPRARRRSTKESEA